jgi:uncharacterized membrane protein
MNSLRLPGANVSRREFFSERDRFDAGRPREVGVSNGAGTDRPVLLAGGIVGFGFGGLLDVLLFHLVLRIHHLISGIVPPTTPRGLQLNLVADGLFSLTMVAIAAVGSVLLWRTLPLPDRSRAAGLLGGALVFGVGAFNLYDGTIDHYVLGLHHVTQWPPNPDVFDVLWVIGSVVLLAAGALAIRAER